MKTIRCPHCQSTLEVGTGYYHDEALNLHCGKCKKVILATTEEDEKDLLKLYTKQTHSMHTPQHGSHGQQPFHTKRSSEDFDSALYDTEGCD